MKNEIDINGILHYYWDKFFIVIIVTIIGAVLSFLFTKYLIKPLYNSSTTIILVKSDSSTLGEDAINASDLTLNSRLISTYEEIIKSETVSEQVINNLNLKDMTYLDMMDAISVNSVKNTDVIKLTVTTTNPELSKNIATELTNVFAQEVNRIYGIKNVSIVDKAKVNNTPINIKYAKNIAIGASGTFVCISILILLIAYFDSSIKNREDVINITGYHILATIPKFDTKNEKSVLSFTNPKSCVSESYRALRTNLEFTMTDDDQKVILITSCHSSEGKSTCAANLATVFAMQGKKTILIDADMRKGKLNSVFNTENNNGLSNLLSNYNYSDKDFIKKTEINNLWLINCGFYPPNPSELISHPRMKMFIEEIKKIFDIVIIDGAPLLPVADSTILAPLCDKVVMVTSYSETHRDELKLAKASLDAAKAKVAGVIINKNKDIQSSYKKYGDGYYGYSASKK